MVPNDRTRRVISDGHNLKHRRFPVNIREPFLLWGWLGTVTGCPERVGCLHAWWNAKAIWKWSWKTRWGVDLDVLSWSPSVLIVLWFCGKVGHLNWQKPLQKLTSLTYIFAHCWSLPGTGRLWTMHSWTGSFATRSWYICQVEEQ